MDNLKIASELVKLAKGIIASPPPTGTKEYVMFYDNSSSSKRVPVEFSSSAATNRFLDKYQNAGGFRRFRCDVYGNDRADFIKHYNLSGPSAIVSPTDHSILYNHIMDLLDQ